MRLGAASTLVVLCLLAPASAHAQMTNAPPGNSAVDQYLETIPVADGDQSTAETKPGARGPVLTKPTRQALSAQGADGQRLLGITEASGSPLADRVVATGASGGTDAPSPGPAARKPSGAPFAASSRADAPSISSVLADAFTNGVGEAGGMGVALPILFGAIAAWGIAASLSRKRRE
jgi:hypothetical protein